jgi:hypothetical protein
VSLALLVLASVPLAAVATAPAPSSAPAVSPLVLVAEGCLADLEVPVETRETLGITAAEHDGVVHVEVNAHGRVVGRRDLEVGSAPCDEIREATKLAIVLSLEELGWLPTPSASPADAARDVAPAAPAPVETRRPSGVELRGQPLVASELGLGATSEPTRGPFSLGTAVDVGVAVGVTSNAALSTSVLVDAGFAPPMPIAPELSVRAGPMVAWPARMTLVGDSGDHDTWMSLWSARLDGCAGVTTEILRVRTCATGIVGVVDGTALESSGYAAVGARAEIGWRASPRATLALSADLLGKLGPPGFDAELDDGSTALFPDPNSIALVMAAGVSTDFTTW